MKMSEDRARILNMLAEGKINAEEAERLLDALDSRTAAQPVADAVASAPFIKGDPTPVINALPKFLYVRVDGEAGEKVNVKVPLALVRSGLKLTSLIPPQAMNEINEQMAKNGISIDFNNFKPEDIDELVEALREMEVSVDGSRGEKVRVYAE
jgi:Asp-tRNA(Asn)/Glu-tRNA(Gln) amidotransferase B subunit